jgi:hypothetical protein
MDAEKIGRECGKYYGRKNQKRAETPTLSKTRKGSGTHSKLSGIGRAARPETPPFPEGANEGALIHPNICEHVYILLGTKILSYLARMFCSDVP